MSDLFLRLWDLNPILAVITVIVVFLFGGSLLSTGIHIRNWILGRRDFPSREAIYDHNQQILPELQGKLMGVFRNAREIAIVYQQTAQELNAKMTSCLEDGEKDSDLYSIGMEIGRLPYTIVRDQMGPADDIEAEIHDLALRHFLKLQKVIQGGKKDGLIGHPATKLYDMILRYALSKAKARIRSLFQENHLAEMTTVEAEAKFTERTQQITRLVSSILNDMWPDKTK